MWELHQICSYSIPDITCTKSSGGEGGVSLLTLQLRFLLHSFTSNIGEWVRSEKYKTKQ